MSLSCLSFQAVLNFPGICRFGARIAAVRMALSMDDIGAAQIEVEAYHRLQQLQGKHVPQLLGYGRSGQGFCVATSYIQVCGLHCRLARLLPYDTQRCHTRRACKTTTYLICCLNRKRQACCLHMQVMMCGQYSGRDVADACETHQMHCMCGSPTAFFWSKQTWLDIKGMLTCRENCLIGIHRHTGH